MTELQTVQQGISTVAADVDAHTCRDDDYNATARPCRHCLTQLSLLSQFRHLSQKSR